MWSYQDTHSCPVCSAAFEDRDHLYTSPDKDANKVFKKGVDVLEKIMEDKETAPDIQRAIIGSMNVVKRDNNPHPLSFGHAHFGRGLSLQSILSDEAEIGWINYFSGRWSVK